MKRLVLRSIVLGFCFVVPYISAEPPSQTERREEQQRKGAELTLELASQRLALATNSQEKCAVVLSFLDNEIRSPSIARKSSSYFTWHEHALMKYTEMLGSHGKGAGTFLKAESTKASGLKGKLLNIALARSGDQEAIGKLPELLANEDAPVLKIMAMRAIPEGADAAVLVPLLKEALKDTYRVQGDDSVGTFHVYPIREEAYRTLKRLGPSWSEDRQAD